MNDIKTMCGEAGISKQTFYVLARQDAQFAELVNSNREKHGSTFVYGDAVLEYLKQKYPAHTQEHGQPSETPETPSRIAERETRISELCEQNAALNALVERLQADTTRLSELLESEQQNTAALRDLLAKADADRRELQSQNSQLLLLLQQEKREKQLFLPKPKKPIAEIIRNFFKH